MRQIDFASCWAYIEKASAGWILLAALVYPLAFVMRSVRWKVLVSPLKTVPIPRLFSFLVLGFFMNNLLPFRLGEIIRAHMTGQRLSVSRSSILATIIVERLFDGLSYVVLFLITILFLPFPGWAKKSLFFAAFLFVALLVFFLFLAWHEKLAIKLFSCLPFPQRLTSRIHSIFANFLGGLKIFTRGTELAKVIIISLSVWTIEGTVFYVLNLSFHLNLNMFMCFFVMIIIGTGAILPTAPGYIGTVEFLGVTSLVFLGVDRNQAFGYIIVLHMMQLLIVSLLGTRSLLVENISISELLRVEKHR